MGGVRRVRHNPIDPRGGFGQVVAALSAPLAIAQLGLERHAGQPALLRWVTGGGAAAAYHDVVIYADGALVLRGADRAIRRERVLAPAELSAVRAALADPALAALLAVGPPGPIGDVFAELTLPSRFLAGPRPGVAAWERLSVALAPLLAR